MLAGVAALSLSYAGDAHAAQSHSWCNTLHNSTANICNQTEPQPVYIPEDLRDPQAMCARYWEILCAECYRYYSTSCGAERFAPSSPELDQLIEAVD